MLSLRCRRQAAVDALETNIGIYLYKRYTYLDNVRTYNCYTAYNAIHNKYNNVLDISDYAQQNYFPDHFYTTQVYIPIYIYSWYFAKKDQENQETSTHLKIIIRASARINEAVYLCEAARRFSTNIIVIQRVAAIIWK